MPQSVIDTVYPFLHLVGRVFFCLFFVRTGATQLLKLNAPSPDASGGGPSAGKAVAAVAALMMLVGAILVLIGWRRFIGAGLLAIAALLWATTRHAFWREQDSEARAHQAGHFLENLALAGAALLIAYYAGSWWPFSVSQ